MKKIVTSALHRTSIAPGCLISSTGPADIFSLACLAHNLVSNVPMFDGKNVKEVLELNRFGLPVLRNLDLEITYEFVRLLKDMLNPDVQQRRTARSALESKWFRLEASALMRYELCEGDCKWLRRLKL